VRPVSDMFLLSVAEISATLIGLLLVGSFFYVETGLRRLGRAREAVTSYLRAGTRIVLVLYGMTLALSLTLVALESIWATVFFAVLSLLLLAANVATSVRIRALAKLTRSTTVLVNDVVSSAGILALVAIPWVLGGLRPTREDLTWAILLSLATALYRHPGPLGLRPLQDGGCRPGRESGFCHGRSSETYRRIETRPPVPGILKGR
jgi:hypothetical protein